MPTGHQEFAEIFLAQPMGSVIELELPEEVEFGEDDFNIIAEHFFTSIKDIGESDLEQHIQNQINDPNFYVNEVSRHFFQVYIDSTRNINLLEKMERELDALCEDDPQAYTLFMCQVLATLPEEMREDIGYASEIDLSEKTNVRVHAEKVPKTVLKALLMLYRDPSEQVLH